jgi:hypothetical protein
MDGSGPKWFGCYLLPVTNCGLELSHLLVPSLWSYSERPPQPPPRESRSSSSLTRGRLVQAAVVLVHALAARLQTAAVWFGFNPKLQTGLNPWINEWFGFGLGGKSVRFSLVLVPRDNLWCGSVLVLNSTFIGYRLVLVQLWDHCQAYLSLSNSKLQFSVFTGH